jgi:hypothetical protein
MSAVSGVGEYLHDLESLFYEYPLTLLFLASLCPRVGRHLRGHCLAPGHS